MKLCMVDFYKEGKYVCGTLKWHGFLLRNYPSGSDFIIC
jgi:hypothetical protein